MYIQYTVLGYEHTPFRMQVSSHNQGSRSASLEFAYGSAY